MSKQDLPLSPHLQIYKPQITSVLSIMHRITGFSLAFVVILFVLGLLAVALGEGYYNKYMAGNIIAMPQPLYGEDVEYKDGTNSSLEQEVNDLVTFLTWTSMPDLEERRSAGLKVIFFLFIMTIVFYLSYRKIWSELKN